jgi:hypothetical protein
LQGLNIIKKSKSTHVEEKYRNIVNRFFIVTHIISNFQSLLVKTISLPTLYIIILTSLMQREAGRLFVSKIFGLVQIFFTNKD